MIKRRKYMIIYRLASASFTIQFKIRNYWSPQVITRGYLCF